MFRGALKGVAVLVVVFSWVWSRTANAGSWQYAAPFVVNPGTNGLTAVSGSGPGMQLFRENPTYNITPYYPPQQPRQSTNWLPIALAGLAMAPMIFSDNPQNHGVAAAGAPADTPARANYQLVRDTPSGQTIRRGPAAIPLRKRYQQASPQQIPSGTQ